MPEGIDHEDEYNGYRRLRTELKRRLLTPRMHPTYLAYFIGNFGIFAAAGIWLEVARLSMGLGDEQQAFAPLKTAIATYFPAILGSVAMQLAISETLRSLRGWGQVTIYLLLFLALILVFAPNLGNWAAILIGTFASALSLLIWWIVNADEHALRDEPAPPEAAVGGKDPKTQLLGTEDLTEYDL